MVETGVSGVVPRVLFLCPLEICRSFRGKADLLPWTGRGIQLSDIDQVAFPYRPHASALDLISASYRVFPSRLSRCLRVTLEGQRSPRLVSYLDCSIPSSSTRVSFCAVSTILLFLLRVRTHAKPRSKWTTARVAARRS